MWQTATPCLVPPQWLVFDLAVTGQAPSPQGRCTITPQAVTKHRNPPLDKKGGGTATPRAVPYPVPLQCNARRLALSRKYDGSTITPWAVPCPVTANANTEQGGLRKNRAVAPPPHGRCTATPWALYTTMSGASSFAALCFKRRFETFSNF
jgi:hypothetical protein